MANDYIVLSDGTNNYRFKAVKVWETSVDTGFSMRRTLGGIKVAKGTPVSIINAMLRVPYTATAPWGSKADIDALIQKYKEGEMVLTLTDHLGNTRNVVIAKPRFAPLTTILDGSESYWLYSLQFVEVK